MKTTASALEFIRARSTGSCVGVAESVDGFTRWYSTIPRIVAHSVVKDGQVVLFHRAMQDIYRRAEPRASCAGRGDSDCASRSTRPARSAFQDRSKRTISARQAYVYERAKSGCMSDVSSSKVILSLSQSSTPSSCASPHFSSLTPTYLGVELDPFASIMPRSDRERRDYTPPPPYGSSGAQRRAPNSPLRIRKTGLWPNKS